MKQGLRAVCLEVLGELRKAGLKQKDVYTKPPSRRPVAKMSRLGSRFQMIDTKPLTNSLPESPEKETG